MWGRVEGFGIGPQVNLGGNAVVLDGDRSYMQNKEASKQTRISYEQGQCVMYVRALVKEGEIAKETDEALKGNRFVILATEGFARRVQEP